MSQTETRDEAIRRRMAQGERAAVLAVEYALAVTGIYAATRRQKVKQETEAANRRVPVLDRATVAADRKQRPVLNAMLRAEIEAAKREAPTARRYHGGLR